MQSQSRNLGFMSSWHMLTRDKGWIKPILVLTLVGWIPILGQIAILGYGFEWARLTAWGIDSAPKQRNVDYGKLLSSGGRAFLITLTLGLVCALVLSIIFPGAAAGFFATTTGMGGIVDYAVTATSSAVSLVVWIVSLLSGTFIDAACLRGTLYDSFSAGWRLDRLFQMIGRDPGGFLKTYLVSLIASIVSAAYSLIIAIIAGLFVAGSAVSAIAFMGISGTYMDEGEYLLHQLLSWGAGPVLLIVVLALALAFIGGAISTAMQLVSVNAVGQWFCRFDVDRWGVSADPLPEGVPHRDAAWQGDAPQVPYESSGASSTNVSAAVPDWSSSPANPASPFPPRTDDELNDQVSIAPAQSMPSVVPDNASSNAATFEVPESSGDEATTAQEPDVVDEEAAREALRAAAESMGMRLVPAEDAASEDAAVEPEQGEQHADPEAAPSDDPDVARKPIPLGPISSEEGSADEEDSSAVDELAAEEDAVDTDEPADEDGQAGA